MQSFNEAADRTEKSCLSLLQKIETVGLMSKC